jgi:hypothetical protein
MSDSPSDILAQAAGQAPAKRADTPLKKSTDEPKSNSGASIKGLVLSMVQSLEIIDGEKEAMKASAKELKETFQIESKISRAAAKIIHTGDKDASDELHNAINRLVAIVND